MPTAHAGPRWRTVAVVLAGIALVVLGGATASTASAAHPQVAAQLQAAAQPEASAQLQAAARLQFTVTVAPDHGPVGSTFTATLAITGVDDNCDHWDVAFYLDGSVKSGLELAPPVKMSDSCSAQAIITVPTSWSIGNKKIYATYGIPFVLPGEQAGTYTVTASGFGTGPTPSGSASATSTSTPTPTPTARPSAKPATTSAAGDGTTTASSPRTDAAASESQVVYTPPSGRQNLADLTKTNDPGLGGYTFAWVAIGLSAIAGLLGAMLVRRRMAAAESEGRHRPAPGRWNASN
jgi:hypothetical protein